MVNTLTVRGVFSTKGPDSSVGGVPAVSCPDVDHMEEEVQVSVQVEEEGMGETHGKEQGEEQKVKNVQPYNVDGHADEVKRSCRHLSQCFVQHIIQHAHCAQKKMTCEVYGLQPRRLP